MAKRVKKRVKKVELSELVTRTGIVPLGGLIRYYLEGWYHGYLEKIDKTTVRIRPIVPKFGNPPRSVNIPIEDVRKP